MTRNMIIVALIAIAAHAASAQTKPVSQPAPAVKPVWPGEGPMKWAPRPTMQAITANDLRTRLYQLADDSMEGRRIGERGNYKGTSYIAAEFKRLGLKPAGDNGTYFQELPWNIASFDSAKATLSVGGSPLKMKVDWTLPAPNAANGVAPKADLQNVPTVFAGRQGETAVVLDPALFHGKVAVFAVAPPGNRGTATPSASCSAELGWPNQRGAAEALALAAANAAAAAANQQPVGGRGAGGGAVRDGRAATAGVAGVLLAGGTVTAPLPTGRGMNLAVQPGGIPTATISPEVAANIFGKPLDQLTVGSIGQPISASWNYEARPTPTPARNVIAILTGSDPARASQYVLVGAHNDHNGVNPVAVDHDSLRADNTIMRPQGANDAVNCRPNERQQFLIDSLIKRARSIRPPRRDSIMNGADDDGSGTVVLLEIAEAFAKEHPARSIIFVSHQGEEAGLLGSKWFVDHPTIPLDSIVAAHNMDMLGKGHDYDVKFGGPASVQTLGSRRMSREFGDVIDSVNAIAKEPMAIDKTWEVKENPLNRFCRSDQVNYVAHNIPVTYFSLGYSRDYHQPTDEAQYIDYDHAARLARFIHDVMTAVADRKDRPFKDGPDPTMPNCGR